MNKANINRIEEAWGFNLGYSLNGAALSGLKGWLESGVDDHHTDTIIRGVKSMAAKFEESGKRPPPKHLMRYLSEEKAKDEAARAARDPDHGVTTCDCEWCLNTGSIYVVMMLSETRKRYAPVPLRTKEGLEYPVRATSEIRVTPQPCSCHRGNAVNSMKLFYYTNAQRNAIHDNFGRHSCNAWGYVDKCIAAHRDEFATKQERMT